MTERSEVLGDIDLLSKLLSGFPATREPQAEPTPVVDIQYSPTFKFIMSIYNTLGEMNRNQQLPIDISPSWIVTLAYTLHACPPHYSAWEQRREVVMNADRFLACSVDCTNFFMSSEVASEFEESVSITLGGDDDDESKLKGSSHRGYRWHNISSVLVGRQKAVSSSQQAPQPVTVVPYTNLSQQIKERLAILLPSPEVDFVQAATANNDDQLQYSPWLAVRWELRQSTAVAKKSHKNFQIWHHRKELISYGIKTAPEAMVSEHSEHFPQIDERILCDDVLLSQDSKNYHVWQHRAWFISALPFLHSVDISNSLHEAQESPKGEKIGLIKSETFGVGSVIPLFHATLDNGRRMPRGMTYPNSPLQKEIDYASVLVTNDVFNNSAWAYRTHLIENYLLPSYEESILLKSEESSLRTFVDFILQELSYAVTQAAMEVCNECPFVYARGICNMYARVMEKVLRQGDKAADLSSAEGISESLFAMQGVEGGDSSFDSPAASPVNLLSIMHRSLVHALTIDVLPIVKQVQVEVKDSDTRYGRRTMFVRMNTHQCQAALHHIGSDVSGMAWRYLGSVSPTEGPAAATSSAEVDSTVLDGTWLLGLAEMDEIEFRAHLVFTRDRRLPLSLKAGKSCITTSIGGSNVHGAMVLMLTSERTCLQLCKVLFKLDEIRSKYWRSEIKRVAFREA